MKTAIRAKRASLYPRECWWQVALWSSNYSLPAAAESGLEIAQQTSTAAEMWESHTTRSLNQRFLLKHESESRILGQWSNPVSGSSKSQASSQCAKQYRIYPVPSWRNHIQGRRVHMSIKLKPRPFFGSNPAGNRL